MSYYNKSIYRIFVLPQTVRYFLMNRVTLLKKNYIGLNNINDVSLYVGKNLSIKLIQLKNIRNGLFKK